MGVVVLRQFLYVALASLEGRLSWPQTQIHLHSQASAFSFEMFSLVIVGLCCYPNMFPT